MSVLVLSRKEFERVKIGDNIELTVVRIGPNNVRLAFNAPLDVKILRSEVQDDHRETPQHTHADSRYKHEFDDGHGPTVEDTGVFPPKVA